MPEGSPVGTEGLAGCVTTPAERSALDAFREAFEKRRASIPKPMLETMAAAMDEAMAREESSWRASFAAFGVASDTTLDRAAMFGAVGDLLSQCIPVKRDLAELLRPRAGKRAPAR